MVSSSTLGVICREFSTAAAAVVTALVKSCRADAFDVSFTSATDDADRSLTAASPIRLSSPHHSTAGTPFAAFPPLGSAPGSAISAALSPMVPGQTGRNAWASLFRSTRVSGGGDDARSRSWFVKVETTGGGDGTDKAAVDAYHRWRSFVQAKLNAFVIELQASLKNWYEPCTAACKSRRGGGQPASARVLSTSAHTHGGLHNCWGVSAECMAVVSGNVGGMTCVALFAVAPCCRMLCL